MDSWFHPCITKYGSGVGSKSPVPTKLSFGLNIQYKKEIYLHTLWSNYMYITTQISPMIMSGCTQVPVTLPWWLNGFSVTTKYGSGVWSKCPVPTKLSSVLDMQHYERMYHHDYVRMYPSSHHVAMVTEWIFCDNKIWIWCKCPVPTKFSPVLDMHYYERIYHHDYVRMYPSSCHVAMVTEWIFLDNKIWIWCKCPVPTKFSPVLDMQHNERMYHHSYLSCDGEIAQPRWRLDLRNLCKAETWP